VGAKGGQLINGFMKVSCRRWQLLIRYIQVSYSARKRRTTYCWLHEGELQDLKTRGDNFLLAIYGAGELQCVQKEDNLLLAT
jgi:hypothetical protein